MPRAEASAGPATAALGQAALLRRALRSLRQPARQGVATKSADPLAAQIAGLLRGDHADPGTVDPVLAAAGPMPVLANRQYATGPVLPAAADRHRAEEPSLPGASTVFISV